MDTTREIVELHDAFEAWFLGNLADLGRVDRALHDTFTFVDPYGGTSDREGTMADLHAGRAHTTALKITTSDHRVVFESDTVVVAEYVEQHQLAQRTNARRATVVFTRDADAPNGLRWLRVHETWLPEPAETEE